MTVRLIRTSIPSHLSPIGLLLLQQFIRTRFQIHLGRLWQLRRTASWTGSTSKSRISFTQTSNRIVRKFNNSKSRNTPSSPSNRRMPPKNSRSSNSIKCRHNNCRKSTHKSRNSCRTNSSRNARIPPSLRRRKSILQRISHNRSRKLFPRGAALQLVSSASRGPAIFPSSGHHLKERALQGSPGFSSTLYRLSAPRKYTP